MYQEVCFNQGTEAGEGGSSCGSLAQPPPPPHPQSYVMPATGLGLQARKNDTPSILQENVEIVEFKTLVMEVTSKTPEVQETFNLVEVSI